MKFYKDKKTPAKVEILIEGYFKNISKTRCRAGCSVVLIQDENKNILVDTGNPRDEKRLINALKKKGLKPEDIDIVVITHFHPDHVGCNHLFKNARFIVSGVAFWDDVFERSSKYQRLAKNLKLIPTPGHSPDSCTLLMKTERGIIACVGDLFWFKGDEKIKLLEEDCFNKKLFYQNRQKILKIADFIIPGHGKMFKVEK
jgi:glyoxylase-like metal-dependent hydrolase (beta-lactamase superfamily II)